MAGFAARGHLGKWNMDRNVGHFDAAHLRRLARRGVFPGRNGNIGNVYSTLLWRRHIHNTSASEGSWSKAPDLLGSGVFAVAHYKPQ